MNLIQITFYPQVCCELCNEVYTNLLDCPVCNRERASSDASFDMWDMLEIGETIHCRECNAEFELVTKEGMIDEWLWKIIK